MKVKKIPMRSCIVTHEKYPKKELIRIVRMPDGDVKVDETGKVNGHGVYIKKDLDILNKAMNNHIIDRVLECEIKSEIYEEIKNIINK